MNLTLTVTGEQFLVIWSGLGELPGKMAFAVMEQLKAQVAAQEATALQQAKLAAEKPSEQPSTQPAQVQPAST